MNKIFLSPPHMYGNEQKYVEEAFRTNWIAPFGPFLDRLESAFAVRTGVKSALAVTNGTSAIHLALRWLGVQRNDLVFCSDFTFIGSCAPVLFESATPVFIDSEPQTWNMSPVALKKAFQWAEREHKMPKAVIVVDLYGESADYDLILPICQKYGVPVIEDSAEAVGTTYKGKECGSFGDISVFSFNGNKIMTTSGGGMILSDNTEAVSKMKFWATQAKEEQLHYEHKDYGYNYRMSNISAAIGVGQLEFLGEKLAVRKKIHKKYLDAFSGYPVHIKEYALGKEANGWMNSLIIETDKVKPEELVKFLHSRDIEARPIWKPMHGQPIFTENLSFSHFENNRFLDEEIFATGLCLPSGDGMTAEEQQHVIDKVKDYFHSLIQCY